MSIYDVFSGGSKPFNKEEWATQKQAERKEVYELIDNTCLEMMGKVTASVSIVMCRDDLTVTLWRMPFWYRHRCPKRHSLKTTTSGNRAVSM